MLFISECWLCEYCVVVFYMSCLYQNVGYVSIVWLCEYCNAQWCKCVECVTCAVNTCLCCILYFVVCFDKCVWCYVSI